MFYFFATFIVSLILLKFFIIFSNQLGVIDVPDERSSHIESIPTSAGIAIFSAVILVILFSDIDNYQSYGFSIVAIFSVFILGVYDDLKNTPPLYKILIISAGAILICLDGLVISNIGIYFNQGINLLGFSIPFTVIAVVGFTNAINLIDGIDGLAGSICIVILSSLWFVGYINDDPLLLVVSPLIVSALLGFLFFNWSPAKVFMGDSGSLTLGFIISILAIKSLDYVPPVVTLYIVAVPVIDTLVIIARRKINNDPVFTADRHHMHHVLLAFFGNERKTVSFIMLVQLFYSLFGFFVATVLPQEVALLLFVLSIVGWYVFLIKLSITPNNSQSVV